VADCGQQEVFKAAQNMGAQGIGFKTTGHTHGQQFVDRNGEMV